VRAGRSDAPGAYVTLQEFAKLPKGTEVVWVQDGQEPTRGIKTREGIVWSDGQFTDFRDDYALEYVRDAAAFVGNAGDQTHRRT
jgi:hypothetical protein